MTFFIFLTAWALRFFQVYCLKNEIFIINVSHSNRSSLRISLFKEVIRLIWYVMYPISSFVPFLGFFSLSSFSFSSSLIIHQIRYPNLSRTSKEFPVPFPFHRFIIFLDICIYESRSGWIWAVFKVIRFALNCFLYIVFLAISINHTKDMIGFSIILL